MAKVAPFHTDLQDHPASQRRVYHDHDDCPEGALLLPHHRKSGTGDKTHCSKCWLAKETIRRQKTSGLDALALEGVESLMQ
jgi:hypothetical protein